MTACSGVEFLFAGLLLCFVISALVGGWHYSSLLKTLELRHPGIHQILGRPHVFKTADSDKHGAALNLFIKSDTHERLGDIQLSRTIKILRACGAIEIAVLVAILGCLLFAAQPEDMIRLGCWRR